MRVIIEYVMHSTRRLIILKVTQFQLCWRVWENHILPIWVKHVKKHELMLLAVIIILHFTTMLEHVSVCFEIVTCHYLTQWNKILKLPNTTLKKNVGSQAHRLTVNFLKEHPFKYI